MEPNLMQLLAFAASSSRTSINKKLVTYATSLLASQSSEVLDLNDYELPLFSTDKEKEIGSPNLAKQFFEKITQADAIVISFAEHNGSYTAAYKNLFDWVSRIEQKVFQNKPIVLLATSPGKGGAQNVLANAASAIPHFGGIVKGTLSVPEFFSNFDVETNQLTNIELRQQLQQLVNRLS